MSRFSGFRPVKIAAAVTAAALALAGCGLVGGNDKEVGTEANGVTTLKIGVSPVPHGDIVRFVNDELAEDAGLNLEIIEYNDYNIPNQELNEGGLDANYFQHEPWFDEEVEGQGYDLAHFAGIHIEPFALYSDKYDDVADIPDGAKIGINNDPSNQGRGLELLQEAGLITLADGVDGSSATLSDVEENDKNIEFIEADAASLARTLQDVDASVINGNNALEAGLSPVDDSLIIEDGENNPYANFLAVRAGDENNEHLKKLDELLHSDEVRDFIEENWPEGEVLPAF